MRTETIGGATLMLADAFDILPVLNPVDVIITDPPYSEFTQANARTHKNRRFLDKREAAYLPFSLTFEEIARLFNIAAGKTRRWFVASMDFRHAARLEQAPPEGMRFIRIGVWVKNNSAPQFSGDRSAQSFEAIAILHRKGEKLRWNGGGSRGVWITDVERNNGHPTAKPLNLVTDWVRKFTDEGDTVLDPFMGSGTTGIACLKLGRKFVGIEKRADYFDLACRRITEACRQGELFPPGHADPQQGHLL
jgi:site-specific DNA-methyltransferase (adenine-specific)